MLMLHASVCCHLQFLNVSHSLNIPNTLKDAIYTQFILKQTEEVSIQYLLRILFLHIYSLLEASYGVLYFLTNHSYTVLFYLQKTKYLNRMIKYCIYHYFLTSSSNCHYAILIGKYRKYFHLGPECQYSGQDGACLVCILP